MNKFTQLFTVTLIITGIACNPPEESTPLPEVQFTHGVASGDPFATSVVLWTRAVPTDTLSEVPVRWEVSKNEDFNQLSRQGLASGKRDDDYTVKVIADSLEPGLTYYYRFYVGDQKSQIGRTRTAPAGTPESIQFAIVSCSNYEWGYFNAYNSIAARNDINAVLHLGDYIYEYGTGVYGDTTIGRIHQPLYEIITLDDYRQRYQQYRSDPDLQLVHQQHPFITIWDDHEIANNAYTEGAQNHQEDEGDYQKRRSIARKVYYEWMPVRENASLYRSFSFGGLVDLFMLDERLAGRTSPVENSESESYYDSSRTMLGEEQYQWLAEELNSSHATWQLLGNQVIYSYLNWSDTAMARNMDAWDGYPAEQRNLAELFKSLHDKNIVIVTGDTHSSWAFEVVVDPFEEYDPATSKGAFALEFGVTSINSANSDEQYPAADVMERERAITNTPINPHLKYTNLRDHGYMILQLGQDSGRVEYYFMDTLRIRDSNTTMGPTFLFAKGSKQLREELK